MNANNKRMMCVQELKHQMREGDDIESYFIGLKVYQTRKQPKVPQ